MLVFVAVRGDKMRTIRRTIDRDFAVGAATDGADFFSLGGAEPLGFALFTDRTGHGISSVPPEQWSSIRRAEAKDKIRA
jgi:hypothetical protein